uniref:ATP-binding protein n=1 Tax=Nocardia donostiensis TaxID=1538463 RepID=UPI00111C73B0|nr:ATP-binding protein [Nocardia donostiensis]
MAAGSRAAPGPVTATATRSPDTAFLGRFRAGSWGRGLLAVSGQAVDEGASDRILRRIGLSIGLAGVIAAVMELPEIAAQSRSVPLHWSVIAVILAFGLFPVLALVSLGSSRQVIQRVSGAAAISFFAAMVVLMIVYAAPEEHSSSVWVYRVLALGVLAAALAWPTGLAIAYLVLGSALAALANMFVLPDVSAFTTAGDFARTAGLCALFLWCLVYARAAAARVDHESQVASSRAAAVAGAAARDRERARFAALIHDAVLSTLLDASRAGTESPVLRRQAERTLEQLEAASGGAAEPDLLDAQSAIGFLRSAVTEVNPGIEVTAHRQAGVDDLRLPVQAASTIAAALAEAARNSLRHAAVPGREVRRQVTVTVSAGGLRVVFRDDGAGFDQSRVPGDRLGISVSILGRMRQLAGGAGFVESQPGEGTTVTLMWGGEG